jgi:16S rRNA (guanine527-N7)-methyltransferase
MGRGLVPPLGPEEFQRETGVSRETLLRLTVYADLLTEWTRAINLVSRASLGDLWRRHMLDSAQLSPLLPRAPARRPRAIVDLGSGAGFPGLVLAILGAGDLHLVESDRRKAAFLREVVRETGCPARIHATRIEEMAPVPTDVVTARACAPLAELLGYAYKFPGQVSGRRPCCLFLKGRRVEEELTEARKRWKMKVEPFPSRTDPGGTILRIGLLNRESTTS